MISIPGGGSEARLGRYPAGGTGLIGQCLGIEAEANVSRGELPVVALLAHERCGEAECTCVEGQRGANVRHVDDRRGKPHRSNLLQPFLGGGMPEEMCSPGKLGRWRSG